MARHFRDLATALVAKLSSRKAAQRLERPLREPDSAQEAAFDELARALAIGASRREVLRRAGLGLASAVLASLGLRTAWAEDLNCTAICRWYRGIARRNCLRTCRFFECSLFCDHLPTLQAILRCRRDAAARAGLCEACDADPQRLCRTPSGQFVCCAEPNACVNGECRSLKGPGTACGKSGAPCPSGFTCAAVGLCCPTELPVLCGTTCNPPGTMCCGPDLPCAKGGVCCQNVCFPAGNVCCERSGACPSGAPVCVGGTNGVCCPTDRTQLCQSPSYQSAPALVI